MNTIKYDTIITNEEYEINLKIKLNSTGNKKDLKLNSSKFSSSLPIINLIFIAPRYAIPEKIKIVSQNFEPLLTSMIN